MCVSLARHLVEEVETDVEVEVEGGTMGTRVKTRSGVMMSKACGLAHYQPTNMMQRSTQRKDIVVCAVEERMSTARKVKL